VATQICGMSLLITPFQKVESSPKLAEVKNRVLTRFPLERSLTRRSRL
jgi:hypothetical protein